MGLSKPISLSAKFPVFTLIWLTAPINVYNSDFIWPQWVTSSIYQAENILV